MVMSAFVSAGQSEIRFARVGGGRGAYVTVKIQGSVGLMNTAVPEY